jgi:hypothetical protein
MREGDLHGSLFLAQAVVRRLRDSPKGRDRKGGKTEAEDLWSV